MHRDLPYFRLKTAQRVSLRELFNLDDTQDIELIIIQINENCPNGKVNVCMGDERTLVTIDKAFTYGFNKSFNRLNVRTEKLECFIEALNSCAVSISVKLR